MKKMFLDGKIVLERKNQEQFITLISNLGNSINPHGGNAAETLSRLEGFELKNLPTVLNISGLDVMAASDIRLMMLIYRLVPKCKIVCTNSQRELLRKLDLGYMLEQKETPSSVKKVINGWRKKTQDGGLS